MSKKNNVDKPLQATQGTCLHSCHTKDCGCFSQYHKKSDRITYRGRKLPHIKRITFFLLVVNKNFKGKGGEKLTGFQVFIIAVDIATIIVDAAIIIHIARRWKE